MTARSTPVAIIGIGCRFPGGIEDPLSFWDVIASGTDAITDIPPDRWRTEAFFDPDPATPGRMFVRQGGFLRSPVDRFDAAFFGMTPREAAALDPQQRLLLEVTWEALEDAGLPPGSTAGASVGTYIGGFTFDTASAQLSAANRPFISSFTSTGVSMTMLSARLSYTFDWRGPCLTMDTACSSSLVALHHACVALDRGECDLAVAGGVNVMVNPMTTILMSKGQFLSPDARCKSFDERANGYARGEGAGLLLLKPLAAALRDHDRIYAVVRGTAVNQDGRTPGITVPSAEAQQALIRKACQVAGVEPSSVGYYEAHGTGTAVGDPIEAMAIGQVLADSDQAHWMGSVKSNIGHTEAAAGVAAVIKAALCLRRGLIPPNLHFEKPNPKIPFENLPLRVPTQMVPFPEQGGPRRAGVNSFGFGGTNAHAILEQAPPAGPATGDEAEDGGPSLLVLSARSPQALRDLGQAYAGLLCQPHGPALRQVSRAAARQRDHHRIRAFIVADTPEQAIEQLRTLEPAGPARAASGPVAFVYTGMGPQWWGMGRELLFHEPIFARVVAACDEILAGFGLSMARELRRDEASTRLTSTLYAQVANFVVQAGLTALWREWGIEPAVVTGHSVGEVAAAYAAGVYSLPDALTISFHRASLQAKLAGRGPMVAVGLPAESVRAYLVTGAGIAAVNAESATTLSGDPDAMAVVAERLAASGIPVQALRVEVAYHSHQMDEIREPLLAALDGIRPRPARVPLVSTVTGGLVDGTELDAEYWWRNVRQPVMFAAAFAQVLRSAPGIVVEVGPHPVLAPSIDEALAQQASGTLLLPSLNRRRPQRQQLLETLGAMYAAGADPAWERIHQGPTEHLQLPLYPWQREHHWAESASSRETRLRPGTLRFTGLPAGGITPTADVELSAAEFPYLADHRIGPTMVFPGTGYLEAALAMFQADTPCFLEGVRFVRPLTLTPPAMTTLRVAHDPATQLVTLHSRAHDDEEWTLNARMRRAEPTRPRLPQALTRTLADLTADLPEIGPDEVYADLDGTDLNYGPAFRGVVRMWVNKPGREVFAEFDVGLAAHDGHRLHPALLDSALQAMTVGALRISGDARSTYIPAGIDEFRFFREPGKQLWLHGQGEVGDGQLACDFTLFTDDGAVVAEVTGLRAQRLAGDHDATATARGLASDELYYESAWLPEAVEQGRAADGEWVLVSSGGWPELERMLTQRGGTVVRISAADEDWLERLVAHLTAMTSACRGVICACEPPQDEAACGAVATPLRLVQALPARGVPLFLVTRGAQSAWAADPTDNPSGAAVWGFGRVVSAERPELRCRLIDLAAGSGAVSADLAGALIDELTSDAVEEVALRLQGRYVRRLRRAGPRSPLHHATVHSGTTPVRLTRTAQGIDGLGFTAVLADTVQPGTPGPGQVTIEVAFAGLNFKDLLKVAGLMSADALRGSHTGDTLGMECSGTIVAVGAGVTHLRPGDEVFAHSRDLFASRVNVDAIRVVRKPAAVSLAQAAALLPSVTAHQALVRLAGVKAGDRVLIHSAAGGVGLAATRIAVWLGAEVYATAGTQERREFLRAQGVRAVSDSRSTTFADDIRRWTDGRGVDVVVNSLAGEMLRKSVGLLSPFGRFVELGKADIAAERHLNLGLFDRALSFHAFDYDQMMRLQPARVLDCMREVAGLYDAGAVEPPLVTEMAAAEVGEAFRAMSQCSYIGKIVVRMAQEAVSVPASSLSDSPVRGDATYVITGGLGGLGRTVARMLADLGARHLVLVGRSGAATPEARAEVGDLAQAGIDVRVMRANVGDRGQVRDLFARIRTELPPVRGIFHAAADFDDAVLSDTSPARLIAATGPKADGAWYLHLETEPDDLDFFVLFSSFGAQIGASGASAYVTANEFLNGLARYRHARGLPAMSIGWGMVDEVGVAANWAGAVGNALRRNGHIGLAPARLAAELETLLRTRPVEVSVAGIDWSRWAQVNSQLASLPRYQALAPAVTSDPRTSAPASRQLREADPEQREALLAELIIPLLRQATGMTQEQLEAEQAVDIDSLVAVELRVSLQNALGVTIPAVKLQRNLTVAGLSGLLADELDRTPDGLSGPVLGIVAHQFESCDGLTIFGHLSLPPGPGPHPAVVVCTSGAGGALDEQGRYARLSEHAPLLAAGFAVFTVDQRGTPGHGTDFSERAEMGGKDIDDVVCAAGYLASLPEIDPARLSILGTSRGGATALLALARAPGQWHRGVLIMGLYDPAVLAEADLSRFGGLMPPGVGVNPGELKAYFAALQQQAERQLGAVTAPLLLLHGDADDLVPIQQSRRLVDLAREQGLPARLITVPGLGHDNDHEDAAWAGLWPQITQFLGEEGT